MMKRKWSILLLTILMAVLLTGCQISTDWNSYYPSNQWGSSSADVSTLPNTNNLIPISDLMGYAEYTPPQISSDGTKILYRHMAGNDDNVIVEDWKTGTDSVVPWPQDAAGNPNFMWAPDGETVLFFVDDMGDEDYGLYTTNITTGATKTILAGGDNNCYYVSDNPVNKKEIYLEKLNQKTSKYDLYRCNYETGELTLMLTNPGDITNFIFDHDGNLRLVTRIDKNAGTHTWMKGPKAAGTTFNETDWTQIPALSWTYEDADTSGVTNFMQDDNRVLYTDSSKSNTAALYTYDLATGTTEKVFEDPDFDIGGTWTDLKLDKVTAVNVYADKIQWHVLDSSLQAD